MAARLTSVALLGAGRWGRQLLRVLEGRCRLVQVGHRGHADTAAWLAGAYPHLARTTDGQAILRDPGVEAVVIATPIATHAALVQAALEAGKHVFVEKPLATDPAEARALVQLAAAQRRVLFVGHVFLYHPAFERLQQLAVQDPVRFAAMAWQKLGTFEEDLYWNLVSHELAIAMTLFGSRPMLAQTLDAHGLVTACDAAAIRLGFDEARACLVTVNRCAPAPAKHLTCVTEGGQVLAWNEARLLRLTPARAWEPIPIAHGEPLAREVDAFLACVRGEAGSEANAEMALAVVELVDQLRSFREPAASRAAPLGGRR